MKGWKNESWRHSLAAKGIKTWQKEYKPLVKPFPGENPRLTEDFARFRQQDPGKFSKFRTKKRKDGKELIFGYNKKTHKWELQSILVPRVSLAVKDYKYVGTSEQDPESFIKENLESHGDHSIKSFWNGVTYVLSHPLKEMDDEWVSYNESAGTDAGLSKHPVERAEERGAALFGRVLSQANMEPLIERGQNGTFRDITTDIAFGRQTGVHKSPWIDRIKDGLADKKKPSDFDQEQLVRGTKVEMEHTSDKNLATEIAMDHLYELGPAYYDELEKMEKRMEVE